MAHLPAHCAAGVSLKTQMPRKGLPGDGLMAGSTGLEPATSGVTGRRSNQLNYDPARSGELKVQSDFYVYFLFGGRYRDRTCDSRRVKPVLYR